MTLITLVAAMVANSSHKNLDKTHKLPFLQCYHTFSNSRGVGLLKNYYEP